MTNACEKAIDFRKTETYRNYNMYKKHFEQKCLYTQRRGEKK